VVLTALSIKYKSCKAIDNGSNWEATGQGQPYIGLDWLNILSR